MGVCSGIGDKHTILKAEREITGKLDIQHLTRRKGKNGERKTIQSADDMAQPSRRGYSYNLSLFTLNI